MYPQLDLWLTNCSLQNPSVKIQYKTHFISHFAVILIIFDNIKIFDDKKCDASA